MGAGAIGGLFQMFGNIASGVMSEKEKNKTALQEQIKARHLEDQANQVVPKDVTKDPAYKMKAFLAAAGIPGYEDSLKVFGQNEANALETAKKVAPSGGALLETLGALETQKNTKETALNAENARYIEGKKIDLADTRYTEQEHFDELAREQKSKLNYAATQYENAALEQHQAAVEQEAGLIGKTFSDFGSMVGGGMGGGGKTPGGSSSSPAASGTQLQGLGGLGGSGMTMSDMFSFGSSGGFAAPSGI